MGTEAKLAALELREVILVWHLTFIFVLMLFSNVLFISVELVSAMVLLVA